MKLADHVERIRQLIDKAFRNRFGRMGISANTPTVGEVQNLADGFDGLIAEKKRIEDIRAVFINETGSSERAFEKLVEEFTFTLFNRLAALKVMEAHRLHPEIVTRQAQYADRSFAHHLWLEQNPDGRQEELEGLLRFLEEELQKLSADIPLFSPQYSYHLLPTAIELNGIINAFNQVETDAQVETEIWRSDDVLGWLYESYNNYKKAAHKDSGDKTEYNKVSIQSQVYTPRWVVKFLVDNSLGKLYLEMFPDSDIKNTYKIANAPTTQTRDMTPLSTIRLIDPAMGSGNFLLYAFDLFYDLYQDQIDYYGADYNERKIPELIIKNNLHGVDLDDRAVQIAQLGLYIKAKRKQRNVKIDHFNLVSSDFFLPPFADVKHLFEQEGPLSIELEKIVIDLWGDLQQAYKFGSLIRLEEKFSVRLHGLVQKDGFNLFTQQTLADYEQFKENFFDNLQRAVVLNAKKDGVSFLNTKTQDALTFLELLTQKYDVAVANPPYTDSSDFGAELKVFIENNYKKPYKFNTNLYATFIKRCCEIIGEKGKVAMVHPPTFMYIKTFEDVRKYMIEKMHISLFVEWGYLGMFNPMARVDAAMYVLENEIKTDLTQFIKLNDIYEGRRYDGFVDAYNSLLSNQQHKNNYTLTQSKLKIIETMPFIYWISDGFREKFRVKALKNYANVNKGIDTSNNSKYLRFFWEVIDSSKWVTYSKGGPYNKWFGNLWLKVNWENNGEEIKNEKGSTIRNQDSFFKEGITYSGSGSKGVSFRYLPKNCICDNGGSSVVPLENLNDVNYLLSFANSKLIFYITDCLNPTVNIQIGDIERIPFVKPPKDLEEIISTLAAQNINIKKQLCTYSIIEKNFENTPLSIFKEKSLNLREQILTYLSHENAQLTQVLLNEAIINALIFDVYELSAEDRAQVEAKMGKPVGSLPVLAAAKQAFLKDIEIDNPTVTSFIDRLETVELEADEIQRIKADFATLYQSNNDLEEFCIKNKLNPINVWYLFGETLPQGRAHDIALEFLTDAFRSLLTDDEDGIIPLVGLPDEPKLLDRFEQYYLDKGFSSAQFSQLDSLLGRPVNEYIEHSFFQKFSDHLNLFMYLPKTPFIWHLSSGEHQGFEAYILIYKWNRDSLFKLKTQYLSKRQENLEYRQIQLADSNSAQAQNEKERIRLQLQEIAEFTAKIDDLIKDGYDPKLDDGVGKNIAPLQKRGLLRSEVLNKKQLDKYLKADW